MNFDIKCDELLNEKLYHTTHKTGVEIYILPKKGYGKGHAMFATRYGSIDSEFEVMGTGKVIKIPNGTAHFLEHKMFDEKGGNVFDKFSLLGASANAFTGFTNTAYHFSATENFKESLEVLIKFVQNPYFTAESVAKEQGIIGQEIRMYDDNPHWRVYFNLLGCLYNECYVKYDIAGTVESIAEIDDKVLYDIYKTFYHPSNMVLFVAGDFGVEEIYEVIEKSLHDTKPLPGDIKRIYPAEKNEIAKDYTEQRLDVAIPLFTIGFKDTEVNLRGKDMLKKEIVTKILHEMIFGKSTELYKSLYDQGLINDSFDSEFSSQLQYAYTALEGESKNPRMVYDKVLSYLENYEPCDKDYERAKRVIWGDYVRSYNSCEGVGYQFMMDILNYINLFDFTEVFRGISFSDIKSRKQSHFNRENSALSVVLPIEQK